MWNELNSAPLYLIFGSYTLVLLLFATLVLTNIMRETKNKQKKYPGFISLQFIACTVCCLLSFWLFVCCGCWKCGSVQRHISGAAALDSLYL